MRCNVSLSSARVSCYTTAKDDTTTGQWVGGGHIIAMVQWGEISGHERVCGFATHLAGVRLLLGVHPHVRQQFVLGVEGGQLPRAVL